MRGDDYSRTMAYLTLLLLLAPLLLHSSVWAATQEAASNNQQQQQIQSYLTAATKAFATSDVKGALSNYDRALALEPDNYLTLFRRAVVYSSALHIPQAITDFTRVLEINPSYDKALFQRGKMFLMQGNIDKALADLKKYTSLAPAQKAQAEASIAEAESARQNIAAAKKYVSARNWQEAIQSLSQVMNTCPYDMESRKQRAEAYLAAGMPEPAISDYSRLSKLQPSSTELLIKLSTLYLSIGELENSLKSIKDCLKIHHDNKACAAKHRELKAVAKVFKTAQDLESGQKWKALADILVQEKKGVISQVEALHQPTLNQKVYTLACRAFFEAGKNNQTVTYCTKVIDRDSTNEDALYYRAQAYISLEMYQEAVNDLSKAMQHNNQSQRLHDALGKAQRLLKQSQRKDYYKILEVPRTADKKEIKRAFRAMSRQYHPDKYRGDLPADQVQKKMAQLNEAYEVLSNDDLRARFDNGEDPNDSHHNQHHGFHQQGFHGHPFSGGFPGGGGGSGYHFHFGF